ncbi:MAG: hypothetical protein C4309_13105 [Chloroflexota bacterium]
MAKMIQSARLSHSATWATIVGVGVTSGREVASGEGVASGDSVGVGNGVGVGDGGALRNCCRSAKEKLRMWLGSTSPLDARKARMASSNAVRAINGRI